MKARHCAFGILAAAIMVGPALAADPPVGKQPLAKMTCEDFLGLEASFQPKAVYWAAAYGAGGKPEAADVDVDGIETVIPFVAEECRKTPREHFWKKVKSEIEKIEKRL